MMKFDKQWYAIEKHGKDLQAIFPNVAEWNTITLYKKLRCMEGKLERIMELACSDETFCRKMGEDGVDKITGKALARLDKILGFEKAGIPVFINRDPRGYVLKIESEYVADHKLSIHRDFGGYGILAPEIGKDGR